MRETETEELVRRVGEIEATWRTIDELRQLNAEGRALLAALRKLRNEMPPPDAIH